MQEIDKKISQDYYANVKEIAEYLNISDLNQSEKQYRAMKECQERGCNMLELVQSIRLELNSHLLAD